MSWPRYEPAGPRCTNRVQPGAQELMNWVLIEFGRGARNGGIYNCRTVRGSANRSLHGEGRAIDASFPVIGGRANANGHALLNVLLRHRMALGVQLIIWDRRIWSASSPNGRRYTGQSPHIDHLHIELTWHAARTLTRTRVRQVVAGHVGAPAVPRPTPVPVPAPAPPPVPEPEEDDDMGSFLRDQESGAIYHLYGERFRHLNGSQWRARDNLAKLAGKPIKVQNMHPWAIAKFLMDMDLIKDPT